MRIYVTGGTGVPRTPSVRPGWPGVVVGMEEGVSPRA
jgi:hypothetical protein